MNRLAIVLCALVAVAIAAPATDITPIAIVKQALDGPSPDGSYNYAYETANGIQAQEDGHLNKPGTDEEALQARGSFSYTGDDGVIYQVSYVADENGFQPVGDHLPTAPPVPELIQKSLKYNAEHPEEDDSQ